MMFHSGLLDTFWAEAVECAAYIRNRTPTSAIKGNKTPLEVWSKKKSDVSHLKVFGCVAYAHVPDAQRQKLIQEGNETPSHWLLYSVQALRTA